MATNQNDIVVISAEKPSPKKFRIYRLQTYSENYNKPYHRSEYLLAWRCANGRKFQCLFGLRLNSFNISGPDSANLELA